MTFKLTKIAAATTVAAALTFSMAFADTAATDANAATQATPHLNNQMNKASTVVADASSQPTTQMQKTGDMAATAAQQKPASTATDTAKTGAAKTDTTNMDATAAPTNTNKIFVTKPATPTPQAADAAKDAANMPANTANNMPQKAAAATTTASTQTMAVIPQTKLVDFSQKAALATFTYDHTNYQQNLKTMQSYFTKSGWASFNKALTASNNLDVVQKEKLTVTAKLNGQTEVTQHQQTATGQQWQVTVPVAVTYKNDKNQQIQQDLKVKLAITTVSTDVNPNGIGVNQFIAMPAGKATTEKTTS